MQDKYAGKFLEVSYYVNNKTSHIGNVRLDLLAICGMSEVVIICSWPIPLTDTAMDANTLNIVCWPH